VTRAVPVDRLRRGGRHHAAPGARAL